MITLCNVCKKTFEQNQDPGLTNMALAVGRDTENERCYSCALDYVTGGRAPEESDFNTAHLISGQMSDKEWRWLQEDFRSLETGRSIRETDFEEDEYWCYRCCRSIHLCICDDPDEEF